MNDEFEGSTVNEDIWQCRRDGGAQLGSNPNNAAVENGNLVLKATTEDYDNRANSHIFLETRGKFNQVLGCFTARIKVCDIQGVNTAFWMLPEGAWGHHYLFKHDNSETYCGEIDMLEATYSFGNKYMQSLHYWNAPGSKIDGMSVGEDYGTTRDEFHEYTTIWTKDGIYLYYDGILKYSFTGITATGIPAYMILSVELGRNSADTDSSWHWIGNYNEADLPAYAYVDYVRVYK